MHPLEVILLPKWSSSGDSLMRTLAQCGVVTLRQVAQGPDPASARWISSFARESGLFTLYTANMNHRDFRYARLTKAGARYVRQYLGLLPYRTRSTQLLHDLTLAGFYLRLNAEERETWQNPDHFLARSLKGSSKAYGSLPDGMYHSAGQLIIVEIVGSTLSDVQLDKKRMLAEHLWNVSNILTIGVGTYAATDV